MSFFINNVHFFLFAIARFWFGCFATTHAKFRRNFGSFNVQLSCALTVSYERFSF